MTSKLCQVPGIIVSVSGQKSAILKTSKIISKSQIMPLVEGLILPTGMNVWYWADAVIK